MSETAKRGIVETSYELKPALVLDLDGTVRYNKNDPEGFVNRADEIAIYPDVEERLWEYRAAGYLVCGASNQGGVAFGYKALEGMDEEVEATVHAFDENPFDMILQCYHHQGGSVEPFCHRSLLRKPDIGLLVMCEVQAWQRGRVVVDWENSLMVGDRPEDKECARRAGIAFVWADEFFAR